MRSILRPYCVPDAVLLWREQIEDREGREEERERKRKNANSVF